MRSKGERNELKASFWRERMLELFRGAGDVSALKHQMGNILVSYNSQKTLICFAVGLFVLLSLSHVTKGSECGDLGKYIGATCSDSTSGGWGCQIRVGQYDGRW
jgi:hypothetical protein